MKSKNKVPKDDLTICPKCGQDGCYVVEISKTAKMYFSWCCGYTTTDLMKTGEFDFDLYEETLPELYKDLKHIDTNNRVWYPTAININEKGSVFAFGTSLDNWQWSAIKTIPLTEAEKEEPRFKGATHKSDAKTLKYFGNDFIEACSYIGLFD